MTSFILQIKEERNMQKFKIVRAGKENVLTDKELQEAVKFALKQKDKVAIPRKNYEYLVKCENKVIEDNSLYDFIYGKEEE